MWTEDTVPGQQFFGDRLIKIEHKVKQDNPIYSKKHVQKISRDTFKVDYLSRDEADKIHWLLQHLSPEYYCATFTAKDFYDCQDNYLPIRIVSRVIKNTGVVKEPSYSKKLGMLD